ncbi:mannose/fructose/N-acetylgalactosamine-specific phosphotransferase system component IID [Enterococcus lemanii]|nr:mannose/fructose/N-acetylgalactosamine-specific phosphotransferase system component IID [Enterococcus lemanii]
MKMNNTKVVSNQVDEKTKKSVLWRWFFTSSVSSNYEKM